MSDYCEDPRCEHCGKKLVDLGHGYPVCMSELARRYPVPMDPKYKGFKRCYKVIKCNEGKPKRNKNDLWMV